MDQNIKTNPNNEIKNKELAISSPISYFEKDKNFVFLYKKSEKFLTAIYAVTNLFDDTEPLKKSLREMSASLLRHVSSVKDISLRNDSKKVSEITGLVLELESMLNVCGVAGLVSQMNIEILKKEFALFLTALNERVVGEEAGVVSSNRILPEGFFAVEKNYNISLDKKTNDRVVPTISGEYKRQEIAVVGDKGHVVNFENSVAKNNKQIENVLNENGGTVAVKKNSRQNAILAIIKKKREVTIKDISVVIKEYSEKTIQRELIELVAQGVLKKVGERRWSKYSINS